jgi:hypothetical protein
MDRTSPAPPPIVASAGRALGARDLLWSQRTIGNRATVQALASRPKPTGQPLALRSTPRVQRLVDRQGLEAMAGPARGNIGLIKMSTQYKLILAKLDAYHAKSDDLWQGNVTGAAYAQALDPLLDDLAATTWAYVGDREGSNRTPHLRDLVSVEIPAERRRLKDVANHTDFATLDRATPPGMVGAGKAATVQDAGIDVGYAEVPDPDEGGVAKCHSMALWVELDAGQDPAPQPGDPPGSIYGTSLEYWEEVQIDYNFVEADQRQAAQLRANGEGAFYKQWNDIKMHSPGAVTFSKKGGPIELSWNEAVPRAATRQLRGKNKIGFLDNPGVTPLADKYIKRTLNFRVVVKSGAQRREIFATQVIECDGKTLPATMTYVDSLGNSLGQTRSDDEAGMDAMDPGDNRLTTGLKVQAGDVSAAVPARARAEIGTFVEALVKKQAPAFVNLELNAVQAKFDEGGDLTGPYKAYSRFGKKKYGTADDYYQIAGTNSAPYPQPGFDYVQHGLGGAALLMAIMRGDQLIRMYYTNGQRRPVGAQRVRVRSFQEIPVEEAQAYVESERQLASDDNYDQTSIDSAQTDADAGARDLAAAVQNAVARRAGPRRDKAVVTLLEGQPRRYGQIEQLYNQGAGADTLAALIGRWYATALAGRALDAALYESLAKRIPDQRAKDALRTAWLAAAKAAQPTQTDNAAASAFKTVMEGSQNEVGTAPGLKRAVRLANGDASQLAQHIMDYARTHVAEQSTLEKVYNGTIPGTAGLAWAPATIGPTISKFFVQEFDGRPGLLTFSRLMNRYPGLEYRLRPAYRQVHGDKELTVVTERYRALDARLDVPDPGGTANLDAKTRFLANGPYSVPNFASSVEKSAKFDAAYDPKTGDLHVTLKLAFEFQDTTTAPVKIKNNEVGQQFSKQQWTDNAKAKYKADFQAAITRTWGANAPVIRCTRPGWEDIVARPTFEIQDVPLGQEHNKVKVMKAVLESGGAQAPNKLAPGRSGWGSAETALKEVDVVDKISDPLVHRYLHAPEKAQNIEPAYLSDNRQLVRRLRDFGTIEFEARSTELIRPNQVDVLAEEIGRLLIDPALSRLHGLEVAAQTRARTNSARVDLVANRLAARGVPNPITKVTDPGIAKSTVIVRAAPTADAVKDLYVTKWSRITAAHEFGHMLGLMDEYYGAQSGDVVKKMISDGLLPPDTRSDHLVANPPAATDEARGQTATAKLLEEAQLSSADYTLADGAKSTSIMTGGYELWPQHYITVWEALGRLTAADLGKQYWKLG